MDSPTPANRAAIILLVDPAGRVLLQLRDEHAPVAPNQWGVPGGSLEPGEEPEAGVRRELLEETGLHVDGPLTLFWHGTRPHSLLPDALTEWWVYCAPTTASDQDIVLGEGEAIVFVAPDRARTLDFGGAAAYFVPLFLASEDYRRLAVR